MSRLLSWAGSLLLILSAVFCSLCAVISAYAFPVNIRTLLCIWSIAALLLSALATRWRGKGLLVCLPPALIALYSILPGILAGGKFVVFYITTVYSNWFPMPVLFHGAKAAPGEVTLFFAAAGLVLTFLLSIAVCLRHSATFTFFLTSPIVLLSLVVVDFPPNPWFLLGLLGIYLTMLADSALHPFHALKRGLAVFPAFGIVVLLLGITYLIASLEQHHRSAMVSRLEYQIENVFMQGSAEEGQAGIGWPEASPHTWRFDTESVAVADAGWRVVTNQSLLKVAADQAGTYYLRGYSMQLFDGRSWSNNADALQLDGEALYAPIPSSIIEQYGRLYPDQAPTQANMTITKTGEPSAIHYLPYYSSSHTGEEPNLVTFYHTKSSSLLGFAAALTSDSPAPDLAAYNAQVQALYTQVNHSTAEGLRQLAKQAGIYPSAARETVADQVANYISSSAYYTLSPATIPEGEDFALYFLQTGRQGYCIHFATTAVLMLRSLDIPARFTSGFTVSIPSGKVFEAVVVTDKQAHAWVEVYYDGIGWVPLEVTPSTTSSEVPAGVPHAAAGQTQAPEQSPQEPAPQQPSDRPDGTGDTATRHVKPGSIALWVILFALLGAAALVLRRRTAGASRRKAFGQADTNGAVICAWQYISRLHGEKEPPEEIEALALKARFSRHTLSEDERAAVIDYATKLAEETDRQCNPLQRFRLRYLRGLY